MRLRVHCETQVEVRAVRTRGCAVWEEESCREGEGERAKALDVGLKQGEREGSGFSIH